MHGHQISRDLAVEAKARYIHHSDFLLVINKKQNNNILFLHKKLSNQTHLKVS